MELFFAGILCGFSVGLWLGTLVQHIINEQQKEAPKK